jgi:hypothetical protein
MFQESLAFFLLVVYKTVAPKTLWKSGLFYNENMRQICSYLQGPHTLYCNCFLKNKCQPYVSVKKTQFSYPLV